jgi:hypothetical protein
MNAYFLGNYDQFFAERICYFLAVFFPGICPCVQGNVYYSDFNLTHCEEVYGPKRRSAGGFTPSRGSESRIKIPHDAENEHYSSSVAAPSIGCTLFARNWTSCVLERYNRLTSTFPNQTFSVQSPFYCVYSEE